MPSQFPPFLAVQGCGCASVRGLAHWCASQLCTSAHACAPARARCTHVLVALCPCACVCPCPCVCWVSVGAHVCAWVPHVRGCPVPVSALCPWVPVVCGLPPCSWVPRVCRCPMPMGAPCPWVPRARCCPWPCVPRAHGCPWVPRVCGCPAPIVPGAHGCPRAGGRVPPWGRRARGCRQRYGQCRVRVSVTAWVSTHWPPSLSPPLPAPHPTPPRTHRGPPSRAPPAGAGAGPPGAAGAGLRRRGRGHGAARGSGIRLPAAPRRRDVCARGRGRRVPPGPGSRPARPRPRGGAERRDGGEGRGTRHPTVPLPPAPGARAPLPAVGKLRWFCGARWGFSRLRAGPGPGGSGRSAGSRRAGPGRSPPALAPVLCAGWDPNLTGRSSHGADRPSLRCPRRPQCSQCAQPALGPGVQQFPPPAAAGAREGSRYPQVTSAAEAFAAAPRRGCLKQVPEALSPPGRHKEERFCKELARVQSFAFLPLNLPKRHTQTSPSAPRIVALHPHIFILLSPSLDPHVPIPISISPFSHPHILILSSPSPHSHPLIPIPTSSSSPHIPIPTSPRGSRQCPTAITASGTSRCAETTAPSFHHHLHIPAPPHNALVSAEAIRPRYTLEPLKFCRQRGCLSAFN